MIAIKLRVGLGIKIRFFVITWSWIETTNRTSTLVKAMLHTVNHP